MLMNLPAMAIEFLDVFNNTEMEIFGFKPIHTRCYCFVRHSLECDTSKAAKQTEADIDTRRRICEALGIHSEAIFENVPEELPTGRYLTNWRVRFVRNTAPLRDMYCLEFDLHFNKMSEAVKRPRMV